MMNIDILVMAGGSAPSWAHPTVPNKALISVHGKPCIQWVLDAIVAAQKNPDVKKHFTLRSILLGTDILQNQGISDQFDTYISSPEKNKLSDNVRLGIQSSQGEYILIITGDIPCIEMEHIQSLLSPIKDNPDIDLFVPIVEKSSVDQLFPGSHRTYGKIKEGSVKVANCFLIRKDGFSKIDAIMNQFIENRKSVIKLAFHFGIINLLKLMVTKSISIPELEKAFLKASSIKVKGFFTEYAQLAVDIDKQSDIQDIETYFSKRGGV
jgi:GTP:adenosylcobinamide-phosphate guanylyltransferase